MLITIQQTLLKLLSASSLSISILVSLILVSSIAVIHTAFEVRQLYSQMQTGQHSQDELDSEYEKLLLEQGAWADYARVDEVSKDELFMREPGVEDVIIVGQR